MNTQKQGNNPQKDTPLRNLKGIGKQIEKKLSSIGVFSRKDLEKMGTVPAFQKMAEKFPKHEMCSCLLYTLEGALLGVPWHTIPEELKEKCRKEKKRIFQEK